MERTFQAVLSRVKYLKIYSFNHVIDWSEEDDHILMQYFPIEGIKCAKRLSKHLSKSGVYSHAIKLGLKVPDIKVRDEELHIVKNNYRNLGITKTLELVNNWRLQNNLSARSLSSIQNMAGRLGVTQNIAHEWTDEEIAILKNNYAQIGPKGCSKLINRSASMCSDRAMKLGLKYNDARYYSEEEDAIIKKYYPIEGKNCAKRLPNRSVKNVQQRAIKFGLKSPYDYINKWSEKELDVLHKYYPLGGKYEVIKYLTTKTVDQIASKASSLHLKSPNSKPKRVVCVESDKVYESAAQAIRMTGLKTIDSCLRGKSHTAGGYHWKYLENEDGKKFNNDNKKSNEDRDKNL